MYRPPENTNRVKSIKSKFENIENSIGTKENVSLKNGTGNNVNNSNSDSKTIKCSALPLNLQRQLSDPSKRNIKRTPAFRLDKNSDKVAAFQRTSVINRSQELKNIMKPVSTKKIEDCDKIPDTSEVPCVRKNVPSLLRDNKPILLKSKSSMDFNVLRNKFNSANTNSGSNDSNKESNQRIDKVVKNISALYTEPIPKSLRIKTCDKTALKPMYSNLQEVSNEKTFSDDRDIHKVDTMKLIDKKKPSIPNLVDTSRKNSLNVEANDLPSNFGCVEKSDAVNNNDKDELTSALKKLDTLLQMTKTNSLKKAQPPKKQVKQDLELTDTLKNALKKPLPTGPAPKKPPRTFAHSLQDSNIEGNKGGSFDNFEKNISFLHVTKNNDTEIREPLCLKDKSNLKRNDPKYMLNKLESALRNNKLKTRRTAKTDVSTTSGEDSDDSLLKNSLNTSATCQNRTLPSVPDNSPLNISHPSPNNLLVQALNFNCLNSTNCVSPSYHKLNESKSSFFVSVKNDEPVYAEPWQFEEILKQKSSSRQRSVSSDRNTKNNRNSLYYWSSPVLCSTPCSSSSSSMNLSTKQTDVPSSNQKCSSEKGPSSEISSLSSFTSESASSTPMDDIEKTFEGTVNIKQLIDTFETKTNTKHKESYVTSTTGSNGDDILSKNTVTIDEPENVSDENIQEVQKNFDENEERINELRNTIHKDMDDSFEPNESGSSSKWERSLSERKMSTDDPTVDKFRTYVRNVSVYAKIRPQSKKSTLFDCCLIVEWNADVRRIKFKYPHNVQVPHKIEDLCFPDAACGPLDKTLNAQCYSLVITNDKGERTFGYCRRVVPEGSNKCLPIAYCILSKHKSPRFYKKILIELESRHGISEKHRNDLLEAFYFNKFPQPGETVVIKLVDSTGCGRNKENITNIKEEDESNDCNIIGNNESHKISTTGEKDIINKNSLEDSIESSFVIVNDKGDYESLTKHKKEMSNNSIANKSPHYLDIFDENEIVLNVHEDPIYENSDLKDLHELPTDILQKIFASLLLERKVILISCLLSKLSSCVEALQTIIYPFTWPHSFIPVLPKSLWEFVEAPTPIICGILSVEVLNKHDIEHGIVVDLDEKCIWKEEGDEDKALSTSMLKAWRKSLSAAKNVPVDLEAHSFYLTDAYIHMFAVVLKNYRDYIVNGNFQKEAFIRSNKSKGVRRFLKWFTDTSMFLTFVDMVITNSQDFSQFDKKIAMYTSEQSGLNLDKLLDWKF